MTTRARLFNGKCKLKESDLTPVNCLAHKHK